MSDKKGMVEDLVEDIKTEFKTAADAQVKEAKAEQWRSDPKGLLDILTGKLISRKFLVWLVACAGMFMGSLTGDSFTMISIAYIGSQSLITALSVWRNGFDAAANNWQVGKGSRKDSVMGRE